jgi:hypothetical protein
MLLLYYTVLQEDDTMKVMNAMSMRAQASLDSLKYYIVPASWFLKAYPLLTSRTADGIQEGWREYVGRIENVQLLNIEHAISEDEQETNTTAAVSTSASTSTMKDKETAATTSSSTTTTSDDNNGNKGPTTTRNKETKTTITVAKPFLQQLVRNRQQSTVRVGLRHKRDYFFLGPSAWEIVKEKFGHDNHELFRQCVFVGRAPHNEVAIQMLDEEGGGGAELPSSLQVTIPPSGRFAYEKFIAKTNGGSGSTTSTTDIVSEEDEDQEGNDLVS